MTTYDLRLYTRGKKVYMDITSSDGDHFRYSTGIDIGELNWDQTTQRITSRGDKAREINRILRKVRDAVEEHIGPIETLLTSLPGSEGRNEVAAYMFEQAIIDYMEHAKRKGATDLSMRNMTTHLKRYRDFIAIAGDIDVKAEARKIRNHQRAFQDYLMDEGIKPSTHNTYVGTLKSTIKYLDSEKDIRLPDAFMKIKDVRQVIFLPPDFVSKFIKSNECPCNYETWMLMKFQIITTLRVSDLMALDERNFETFDGNYYYVKVNEKTSEKTYAPIPEQIYTGVTGLLPLSFTEPGRIERYNDGIREILKTYEEMHVEKEIIEQSPSGKVSHVRKPLYDIITSHKLRATGITYYKFMGVSDEHIKKLSGHSANSTAYSRYVGVIQKAMNKDIERAQGLFR